MPFGVWLPYYDLPEEENLNLEDQRLKSISMTNECI